MTRTYRPRPGLQWNVTGVPPTTARTEVALGLAPRPGLAFQSKPMSFEPPEWTARLTWDRFEVRLYGAPRPPSRENPGPPESLMTPCRIDLRSVGSESPPPPDATSVIGPYWLSSSGSLARTLRTASTTGLCVANNASNRVRPPSA